MVLLLRGRLPGLLGSARAPREVKGPLPPMDGGKGPFTPIGSGAGREGSGGGRIRGIVR